MIEEKEQSGQSVDINSLIQYWCYVDEDNKQIQFTDQESILLETHY